MEKIQVVELGKHPQSAVMGTFPCVFCHHKLHGHGWRKRYSIDATLNSFQIWIHRKICPCCGTTYTLLPQWVHAFKLFSLETICRIIEHRIQSDHFGSSLGISGFLQRQWWKGCDARSRTTTDFPGLKETFQSLRKRFGGILASPLSVNIAQDMPPSLMALSLLHRPHQRLYLYVRRGIP